MFTVKKFSGATIFTTTGFGISFLNSVQDAKEIATIKSVS
jgi:hypothetical protein